MKTMYVKPASGLKIRKPGGQVLAEQGEDVPCSSYWMRRLKEGDIKKAKPVIAKEGGK